MAYISRENLFPEVTWYGNRMDTGKDWNCIDKILPYPIKTANGTDDGVTHSDWMARADERTAVLDRKLNVPWHKHRGEQSNQFL